MFSYYGCKSKIVKSYPVPKYELIIEPFAGSAIYSYFHRENHKIWLNDKYDIIYKLWNYLIKVSEKEILELPDIKKGDDIRKFGLSENQQILLGFCVGNGRRNPGFIVTDYGDKRHYGKGHPSYRPNSTWQLTRNRILKGLNEFKNWKITNEDYLNLPDIEATWFIDPPYLFGGEHYVENKIDYKKLSEWCKARKGQIIVCENTKANWLPFTPLVKLRGCKYSTTEAIWCKE